MNWLMDQLISWFWAQEAAVQAATITVLANVGLFFLGLSTIALNAWANRRNTLKASRDEQKLSIYKDALRIIDAAEEVRGKAGGYLHGVLSSLKYCAVAAKVGLPASPPKERHLEFQRLHFAQLAEVGVLHRFLEQWAVVDKRLSVFGLAFSAQHNAVMKAHGALFDTLMKALPTDRTDGGGIFPYAPPSDEALGKLAELADAYISESALLGAYIGDLNVELQPLLLGHLFGRSIPRRDPPDPTQFTIRLDRHEAITAKLRATDYFRRGETLDKELRAQHGTQKKWWRW